VEETHLRIKLRRTRATVLQIPLTPLEMGKENVLFMRGPDDNRKKGDLHALLGTGWGAEEDAEDIGKGSAEIRGFNSP